MSGDLARKMVLNGLGPAALALLLAACGGDGGGGSPDPDDDDASTPEDAGGDARVDAGDARADARSDAESDAEPEPDAEPDAEVDAGDDGGGLPDAVCTGEGTDISASAGGEAVSADGKLKLVLAPGGLSADASVRVCKVPAGRVPSAAQNDGPIGDVYYVQAGVPFDGELVFSDDPLPLAGADAFEPPTLRYLESADASPENAAGAVLTVAEASSLSAPRSGDTFVYLRALDPAAQYSLLLAPTEASYVTGEVIAVGARLEVVGTPAEARSLAVDALGCDVETLEPAGVAQTNGTAPGCGVLTTVVREGDDVDGEAPLLEKDRVIDLTNADPAYPPPSFFCKFPGTGTASARLRFLNGAAAELTVVRELGVSCSYSGDIVSAIDVIDAARTGATLGLGSSYSANFFVNFTPDVRLQSYVSVGPDGVYDFDPTDDSLTPVDTIIAAATGNTLTIERQDGTPDPDFYAGEYANPPADIASPVPPFLGAAGGALGFTAPATVGCTVPTTTQLGVGFGPPANEATTISFTDGSVDAVGVLALGTADGGHVLAVQRWIDPAALPLDGGERTAPLLTAEQFADLPDGRAITGYVVNFFHVTWDEQRAFWPGTGGRIVPVACGLSVRIDAALLAP